MSRSDMTRLQAMAEEWQDCEHCGGYGFTHHDCGEDTCSCYEPIDNVECDICKGEGGWPAQGEE